MSIQSFSKNSLHVKCCTVSMYMHVYDFQFIMKNCRLTFCTYIFVIKLVYRIIKDQFYRSINQFIAINSIPFHAYCILNRKS